jgi:hypothetical protein
VTALLFSLLLTAPTAQAAPLPITVSLAAGYFWTGPDETIASTFIFVPRAGIWLKPHIGAEVDFGFGKGVTRGFGYPY